MEEKSESYFFFDMELKIGILKIADMVIQKVFNRVLTRTYWFYEKIIKEDDNFMKFYYTVFAFSMFIVFYLWGLLLFLERKTELDFSAYGMMKYLLPAIIILGFGLAIFYKKRPRVEKTMKDANLKFNVYDVVTIVYIGLSFLSFFYNLVHSKQ